jgi:sugar lactone lactonase YvrE
VRRLVAAAVAVLLAGSLLSAGAAESSTRERWNTRVFSRVPYPGVPAYVFKHTNGRVYAGTYAGLNPKKTASRVFEWTAGGTLLRSWTVPGQRLDNAPGVQVANQDARGRLVVLERSTSSVLTLNIRTGRWVRQARLPDLPLCRTGRRPCSPNSSDGPAIPNYATWGPDGALYVSDYGQAVIWRIPATGGSARVWFSSSKLDNSIEFGTTGLVYRRGRHDLLIAQQTTGGLSATGRLYRLPITATGRPGTLTTLWRSKVAELPDGFGIARSGRIYLAGVGLTNQLVVLSPSGRELERFPRTAGSGANGSPVPFDGPSNATFVGTRVLVANQSPILGQTGHQVILDVEVGEPGAAPWVPARSRLR